MPRVKKDKGKIRIIPLGGLQEIGKNLTVIEYENDMIVVDCGLGFPDEDNTDLALILFYSWHKFSLIEKLER